MQNVNFHSIDELFEFLPENELILLQALRKLVFNSIPECKEKLSYNVPFYRRHAGICFIWPGAVTWGNVKSDAVRFGFQKGNLLTDTSGYLDKGNRKQVFWRDFHNLMQIDEEMDILNPCYMKQS